MKSIYLRNSLENISKVTDEDKLKFSLYSCYTEILLSKEFFPHNIHTKPFLLSINLDFRIYVFSSRTNIVAKVMRKIEKANKEDLILMRDVAIELVFNDNNNNNTSNYKKKNPKKNRVDSMLEQFGE